MGRPPQGGGPAFRFTQNEVMEMEALLQEGNLAVPHREVINALAEKFSTSAERSGKMAVQPKQVWNWFQNRRHAQRAKAGKSPAKLQGVSPSPSPSSYEEPNSVSSFRHATPLSASSGLTVMSNSAQMEFEAKSARDGAWYDVAAFLSHRLFETTDPEVRVRFTGFGMEEDEWINVKRSVRQRSLPCESSECVAVLPGDLILCFQEGKEQALYFDAHVLDAQRRRHDVRGCRCRFLVRYDHDLSEEIVPLRKVCRRPETDYRLQILQASRLASSSSRSTISMPMDVNHNSSSSKDVSAVGEVNLVPPSSAAPVAKDEPVTTTTTTTTATTDNVVSSNNTAASTDFTMDDAVASSLSVVDVPPDAMPQG